MGQNYSHSMADRQNPDKGSPRDNNMQPQVGGGTPTKGKVPMDREGQFHTFGSIGVSQNPSGFRMERDPVCKPRRMMVTVVAKENQTNDATVLLELGSYQFSANQQNSFSGAKAVLSASVAALAAGLYSVIA